MGNIKNFNFNKLDVKLSNSDYWDFFLASDETPLIPCHGLTSGDCFVVWYDFNNPNIYPDSATTASTIYSLVSWDGAINTGYTFSTIGLTGITFATSYWLLLLSGTVLGFFLLSSGPIGFQYGAEITYPASEGTSNGMLILMGQISGIAFIFGMDSLKSHSTGSMTRSLMVLITLMVISILISFRLKESTILTKEENQ